MVVFILPSFCECFEISLGHLEQRTRYPDILLAIPDATFEIPPEEINKMHSFSFLRLLVNTCKFWILHQKNKKNAILFICLFI